MADDCLHLGIDTRYSNIITIISGGVVRNLNGCLYNATLGFRTGISWSLAILPLLP